MGLDDRPADRRRRARMLRDQLEDCRDSRVRQAMAELPRHAFVPDACAAGAYGDHALAIGAGQTISQPRVVAFMLERLDVPEGASVLDVGAGSGYVSALLARLVGERGIVHAVERQPLLVEQARAPLARYTGRDGVAPVVLHLADGADGLPEHAPFARIHLACACQEPPPALLEQLEAGGRMVVPVGPSNELQYIVLLGKNADGSIDEERLWPVRFVPLLRGHGDGSGEAAGGFAPAEVVALRQRLIDEIGGKALVDLIGIAIDDYRGRLDELDRALATGDRDAVERVAHTVKGSAASLGLDRLQLSAAAATDELRAGAAGAACAELGEQLRRGLGLLQAVAG